MSRMSVLRKRRKALLKWSNGDYKEEVLNTDLDGRILPDKKEWGYGVECTINGHFICAPDRNRFDAIYAAWDCAKWVLTLEPFEG